MSAESWLAIRSELQQIEDILGMLGATGRYPELAGALEAISPLTTIDDTNNDLCGVGLALITIARPAIDALVRLELERIEAEQSIPSR